MSLSNLLIMLDFHKEAALKPLAKVMRKGTYMTFAMKGTRPKVTASSHRLIAFRHRGLSVLHGKTHVTFSSLSLYPPLHSLPLSTALHLSSLHSTPSLQIRCPSTALTSSLLFPRNAPLPPRPLRPPPRQPRPSQPQFHRQNLTS